MRTRVVQTGRAPARSATTAARSRPYIRGRLDRAALHPAELHHDHGRRRPRADVPGDQRHPVRPRSTRCRTTPTSCPTSPSAGSSATTKPPSQTAVTKIVDYETTRRPPAPWLANKAIDRRAVPGRRQRRPGEPDLHPVRRDGAQRPHRSRSRGRPRLRRAPGQQPAAFKDGTDAAGGAAEADVRAGTAPAPRSPRAGTRAASWSSTATTAGRTAGARRATAPPTPRR